MSDNTSAEATITEQQETSADEEVFDVFETEKEESDYTVKMFDYGIAARQVYGNGPDLQVISDDDEQPEVEIPKIANNVFNTIMNNLSIVGSPGKSKPNKEKSESFKVSPTLKRDESGNLGSGHSLTSLDDSGHRDRTDVRSRKSPNTSTCRSDRTPDRAGTTRKIRTADAKTGLRTSSTKLDSPKGLKTSKSNPTLRSTAPKTSSKQGM